MTGQPLISIVTPSFNQGRYLRETLQSLVDQNYPALEVVIQDGGSTDGAVTIAEEFVRRFPDIFRLFVEKDDGQADALNRGFARTTGTILGFLNSDDTLYPGTLKSVAENIDPATGRLVVMGRCLFTGEDSVYVGAEHPAQFVSHFEQLTIWKRGYNSIPQPSVFWHRSVWRKCGGFDVREQHALDYDLFCRFSRWFHFHRVDELWSTYRMHAVSKSAQRSEPEILELCIGISRRYWGPWWGPLHWRCRLSLWVYRQHRHERARHHARKYEEAAAGGLRWRAFGEFLQVVWFSSRMAKKRLVTPMLATRAVALAEARFFNLEGGFTGRYDADQWVGPLYRDSFIAPAKPSQLVLFIQHSPQDGKHLAVGVVMSVNGKEQVRRNLTIPGQYALVADLQRWAGRQCVLELRSDSYFVPREVHLVTDDRRLSVQLVDTVIEAVSHGTNNSGTASLWLGSVRRQELFVPAEERRLVVVLEYEPAEEESSGVKVTAYLDRQPLGEARRRVRGRFELEVDVTPFQGRHAVLELRTEEVSQPALVAAATPPRRLVRLIEVKMDRSGASFFGRYEGDSYIGSRYRQKLAVPPHALQLTLQIRHEHQGEKYREVNVALLLQHEVVAEVQCKDEGEYLLTADLREHQARVCPLELRCDNFFVPRIVHRAPDDRELSVKLLSTRIDPDENGFVGRYDADNFVGPLYRTVAPVPSGAQRLRIELQHEHHGENFREVEVSLYLDGKRVAGQRCVAAGGYRLEADVANRRGQDCAVELRSDDFFVPHTVYQVPDHRQLSIKLLSLEFLPAHDVTPSPGVN